MPSGIYAIRNELNGKMYIGSAVNIARRTARHRYYLNTAKHPSKHLSAAWAKYGESAFEFSTLEECTADVLLEREQYWIDKLQPAYNKRAKVNNNQGLRWTEEHKTRTSESVKEWAKSDEGRAALAENSRKGWADPKKRAARVAALKAAWTPEKRAEQAAKQAGVDNGAKAREVRWSRPGASERASKALKAAWERRPSRITPEKLEALCKERGLNYIGFDGERVTVHCERHNYTAKPLKYKFANQGQGCRHCGFERSSEKQIGKSRKLAPLDPL